MKYHKLVAMEPVSLVPSAEKQLYEIAEEVLLYNDIPKDSKEILDRIQDADCVLLSYTSRLEADVMEKCSNLKYVGMCCSLYSEESANVDIAYAKAHGIEVKGIRDYGDRGVVEFVLSELIRFLHGFDRPMLKEMPTEITGLKVGIVGLGVSGKMIADALQFLGAEISYYSRSRKEAAEKQGMHYLQLPELLTQSEVVFTCLNKNVLLLGREEFEALGKGKLLFNTSIGPGFEPAALKKWLEVENGWFVCDTRAALGDDQMLAFENVFCADVSAGRTSQAFELLSEKVLNNLRESSFYKEK